MSSLILSLPELFKSYQIWVSKNPQSLGDWENSAKWISYFIAGRINNSHIVSELVYCLSNLLVFFNDRIIKNTHRIQSRNTVEKIKLWLTIVEYSEVFCELSASKLWGATGKWMIIVCIQVFKCISRLLLVFHYKEPVIQSPPIPVLDRKNIKNTELNTAVNVGAASEEFNVDSYILKHSGRVVRKIEASPPIASRDWKPLKRSASFSCENNQSIDQAIAKRQIVAETVYIAKPIVHLASMACFGTNTWKPWMVALAMDLTSMELYRSCKVKNVTSLSPQQRMQLSRRTLVLILYLLRSPVYERHTKDRVNTILLALSKIPLAGLICTPLAQYLPFWQSTYFYMWSS